MANVATAALPADVRWMHSAAQAMLALAVLALATLLLLWAARHSAFALRSIRLEGELTRNSVSTVRANVLHKLAGGFFTLDLDRARVAFEAVPWVRSAVVRRVWPGQLVVSLKEHQVAAIWLAEDGNDRLVNLQGEVFEANVGDVDDEALPSFSGPEGSAAQMLALYRALLPVLRDAGGVIERLSLSKRGSWRVQFDAGASIELGRGSDAEVLARTQRFARTLAPMTARFQQRALESADLRHADGYALRLRGVVTGAAANAMPRAASAPGRALAVPASAPTN